MKNTFLLLLISLLSAAATGQAYGQATADSAPPSGQVQAGSREGLGQAQLDSLMQLDFEAFDQDMQGGWRHYANQERFATAAALIETYLERHPDSDDFHRQVMSWHAGQLFAMDGQEQRAIPLMQASRKETDIMMWNDYLDATVAFLMKDREAFDSSFKVFKNAAGNPNFRLLQILDANFEKSYREALEAARKEP